MDSHRSNAFVFSLSSTDSSSVFAAAAPAPAAAPDAATVPDAAATAASAAAPTAAPAAAPTVAPAAVARNFPFSFINDDNKKCDTFRICSLFNFVVNKIPAADYLPRDFVSSATDKNSSGKQQQKQEQKKQKQATTAGRSGAAQKAAGEKEKSKSGSGNRFDPQQWRSTSDFIRHHARVISEPKANKKISTQNSSTTKKISVKAGESTVINIRSNGNSTVSPGACSVSRQELQERLRRRIEALRSQKGQQAVAVEDLSPEAAEKRKRKAKREAKKNKRKLEKKQKKGPKKPQQQQHNDDDDWTDADDAAAAAVVDDTLKINRKDSISRSGEKEDEAKTDDKRKVNAESRKRRKRQDAADDNSAVSNLNAAAAATQQSPAKQRKLKYTSTASTTNKDDNGDDNYDDDDGDSDFLFNEVVTRSTPSIESRKREEAVEKGLIKTKRHRMVLALRSLEKKKKQRENWTEEQKSDVEMKEAMEKAVKRATGEKTIFDNPHRLKKAFKIREHKKEKSRKLWDERIRLEEEMNEKRLKTKKSKRHENRKSGVKNEVKNSKKDE